MKKILIALMFLILPGVAWAQTMIAVDINKAALQWVWNPGAPPNDGTPEWFTVRCGPQSRNYTRITTVSNPAARTLDIRGAITGSGEWYCTVSAGNKVGESADDGEVHFFAAAPVSPPTNIQIIAQ